MAPRIKLGMVGGGNDALIGGVHRIASRIDDYFELVAGALSSTPEKSRASGEVLGLPRIYGDFKQMAIREARRKDGIEAVAIVTPNHMHYPAAREFLKRGIHFICDKPLTSTLPDAKKLVKAAEAAAAIRAKLSGKATSQDVDFPTVHDGQKGVRFVDACVRSSRSKGAWVHV